MGLNDNCGHRYYFAAILLGVEPTEENIREITKTYIPPSPSYKRI